MRWLGDSSRAPAPTPEMGGLPAAPSLLVLVRDWSDLSRVKASAISDAVMSTPPADLRAWLARYKVPGNVDRVRALFNPPAAEIEPA